MKPCSDVGEQQKRNVYRRKADVISLGQAEFEVIRWCSSGDAQQAAGKNLEPERDLD